MSWAEKITVSCPVCWAPGGHPCVEGGLTAYTHDERKKKHDAMRQARVARANLDKLEAQAERQWSWFTVAMCVALVALLVPLVVALLI